MSELIKELRAQANQHQLDADLSYFDIAATKIEELEQQLKQQWVSVDDELPKDGSYFVGWAESGIEFVGKGSCNCFRCGDDIVVAYTSHKIKITHWMPLPKPPTK